MSAIRPPTDQSVRDLAELVVWVALCLLALLIMLTMAIDGAGYVVRGGF